ncbi:MAG: hypothetical protein COA78_32865 [Blastopirellula sp.]|nr:MAG: hypothetical protein COA78_32865 [Blastopirellula sp.]
MSVLKTIQNLDWFSDVSNDLPSKYSDFQPVIDWDNAIALSESLVWENIGIEEGNNITLHLNSVCKDEFQKWNQVVNNAKEELEISWQRLSNYVEDNNLPQVIVDCAKWDTINAVAVEYYSVWKPSRYYIDLLEIYQLGHFPCGWLGEWPSGKMCVY